MTIEASPFFYDNFNSLYLLSTEDIKSVSKIVERIVAKTPIEVLNSSLEIRSSSKISLKLENQTQTQSFKLRGATYLFWALFEQGSTKPRSIFVASTGNHGISIAFLAKLYGIPTTVVVPENTPFYKIEKLREYSAKVVCKGKYLDESLEIAKTLSDEAQGVFISSTSPLLIKGHTSLTYELFSQTNPIDYLFFPVGLGTGLAAAIITRNLFSPKTKLIGVVPRSCEAWILSMQKGVSTYVSPLSSIADGVRIAKPDFNIFKIIHSNSTEFLCVSDQEIKNAKYYCKDQLRVNPEYTGALGLAGLLKYEKEGRLVNLHAASVICGGYAS